MNSQLVRERVERHAAAIAAGDLAAATADFAEALLPAAPKLAAALPQPVTAATVISVDAGEHETTALIRYDGANASLTVRSLWSDVDGELKMMAADPVPNA